jgi:hypothetical protein
MEDFTIVLPELADIGSCDLKVYDAPDQLRRMVERYKMTAPITITVEGKTPIVLEGPSPFPLDFGLRSVKQTRVSDLLVQDHGQQRLIDFDLAVVLDKP